MTQKQPRNEERKGRNLIQMRTLNVKEDLVKEEIMPNHYTLSFVLKWKTNSINVPPKTKTHPEMNQARDKSFKYWFRTQEKNRQILQMNHCCFY